MAKNWANTVSSPRSCEEIDSGGLGFAVGEPEMNSSDSHDQSKTGKGQDFAETFQAAQQASNERSHSSHYGDESCGYFEIRDQQCGCVLTEEARLGSSSLSLLLQPSLNEEMQTIKSFKRIFQQDQ
jgi:hypothetical protein